MATLAKRPLKVLAVFCGSSEDTGCGAVQEFADLPASEAEVHVLRFPSLQELTRQIQSRQSNFLYLSSGIVIMGHGGAVNDITLKPLEFKAESGESRPVEAQQLVDAIGGAELDTVYFDAKFPAKQAEALRSAAVRSVVHWDDQQPAPALIAAFVGKAFFAALRNSTVSAPEAFQMAVHAANVHCLSEKNGRHQAPILPLLLSADVAEMPDNTSIPPPVAPQLDLSRGILAAMPGWVHVRLLAPHADVRLLVCGQSTLVDSHRLSYLGEALRAVLVAEVRAARVISCHPPDRRPAHLPSGCDAVKASLRSVSGGRVSVILGGPPEVLAEQALVEHALRHTLVADALALQIKLPPEGVPAPVARASAAVAGGAPVVETLASSSLWAVSLLKALSQDPSFRGLVPLGIGAVGGASVAAFGEQDAALFSAVVEAHLCSPRLPPVLPLAPPAAGAGTAAGGAPLPGPPSLSAMPAPVRPYAPRPAHGSDGGYGGASADGGPPPAFAEWAAAPGAQAPEGIVDWSAVSVDQRGSPSPAEGASGRAPPRTSSKQPRLSARPPLSHCSESEFLDDVCAYLSERKGKRLNRDTFPDAILNGAKLDLFALYKEVVSRGGFKLDNGINWKSQVFTQMRNWTQVNNMTGVGNALKRHYQQWLLDYEMEHTEDVTGDSCALCGGGEEIATDWISCDSCQHWVHFSCDPRAKTGELGTFRDYATGERPLTYVCSRCAEASAVQAAKKQKTSS